MHHHTMSFCYLACFLVLIIPTRTLAQDGKGSTILVHFDKIGVLEASNLTKDERANVITSVKKKFEGTDVTIVDSFKDFAKEVKDHPEKSAHKIYVNSLESGVAGHARHCGDNGKVFDSKYIDKDRKPKHDELRQDPSDPSSPLDSDKLVNAIENTVAHEIGHLLGLDDDKKPESKPHLMKSPISVKDDVAPLSFTDGDKDKIKNGKFKVSTPNPETKDRQLSFVRGAFPATLPEGFLERTDWVPVSFEVLPHGAFHVGYINALGGFYSLSDEDRGVFDFAPSLPFDMTLKRLVDSQLFTLSSDATDVILNNEFDGSDARFPFDGKYFGEAQILFDTTGDLLTDARLVLTSVDLGAKNGLTLGSVPYAPPIPEPGTLTVLAVALIPIAPCRARRRPSTVAATTQERSNAGRAILTAG